MGFASHLKMVALKANFIPSRVDPFSDGLRCAGIEIVSLPDIKQQKIYKVYPVLFK